METAITTISNSNSRRSMAGEQPITTMTGSSASRQETTTATLLAVGAKAKTKIRFWNVRTMFHTGIWRKLLKS